MKKHFTIALVPFDYATKIKSDQLEANLTESIDLLSVVGVIHYILLLSHSAHDCAHMVTSALFLFFFPFFLTRSTSHYMY